MPKLEVRFYAEGGVAPALKWLDQQSRKVQDKLRWLVERLEEQGSDLKRPHAAPLRDKIYELRVRHMQVNYRLLYFFFGEKDAGGERTVAAVVAHGCTKEKDVPDTDIGRAVQRRARFLKDPDAHTFDGPA